jgi:hypothetical protein
MIVFNLEEIKAFSIVIGNLLIGTLECGIAAYQCNYHVVMQFDIIKARQLIRKVGVIRCLIGYHRDRDGKLKQLSHNKIQSDRGSIRVYQRVFNRADSWGHNFDPGWHELMQIMAKHSA